MATQFGYTETYAVLSENKLTVVSGAFLSSDMMERQSFSQLMAKFAENVKYWFKMKKGLRLAQPFGFGEYKSEFIY